VEQVVGILERQRHENEVLLKALATGEWNCSGVFRRSVLISRHDERDSWRAVAIRRSDATGDDDEYQ
jgi:hypothetical protein